MEEALRCWSAVVLAFCWPYIDFLLRPSACLSAIDLTVIMYNWLAFKQGTKSAQLKAVVDPTWLQKRRLIDQDLAEALAWLKASSAVRMTWVLHPYALHYFRSALSLISCCCLCIGPFFAAVSVLVVQLAQYWTRTVVAELRLAVVWLRNKVGPAEGSNLTIVDWLDSVAATCWYRGSGLIRFFD